MRVEEGLGVRVEEGTHCECSGRVEVRGLWEGLGVRIERGSSCEG